MSPVPRVVSGGAAALLLLLTAVVLLHPAPVGPDAAAADWVRAHTSSSTRYLWDRFATAPGDELVLVPVVLLATGLAAARRRLRSALTFLAASALGFALTELLKWFTARARPDTGELTSFPSGHSASIVYVGLLFVALHASAPRRMMAPRWLPVLVVALAVFIGIGRVLSLRHYPSDVVGGWSFGLAYAGVLCPVVLEAARRDATAAAGRWAPEPPGSKRLL